MGSIDANATRSGTKLLLDGEPYSVLERAHHKPGKGGAFVRFKLKGIISGKVIDHTVRAGTKMETADVTVKTMQYLFQQGSDCGGGGCVARPVGFGPRPGGLAACPGRSWFSGLPTGGRVVASGDGCGRGRSLFRRPREPRGSGGGVPRRCATGGTGRRAGAIRALDG